jgi:hypothetical protein
MSDQDTTQDTEAVDEATEEQQSTDADTQESQEDDREEAWDPERAKRKIGKVNSENKALRERATKAEKKAESVDDLQKQTQTLGSENLRLRVGYELGLPMSLALRLQGETREQMLEDAQQLVELVAPAKRPTQKPTEALRGGLQPDKEPEETDTRKIAERMFRS